MKTHTHFEELLPLYTAGKLEKAQRLEIEKHLSACRECQGDLDVWKAVSFEMTSARKNITLPADLFDQALDRIHSRPGFILALQRSWKLLRTQASLTQPEMWTASAMVMLMGVVVALVADNVNILFFIAPLVAASTLAVIYGPDHDEGLELCLSTPTSPWKILLARMSVVSAYNLLLTLMTSIVLLLIVPVELLGTIILSWLGPLAFLSALALLLSIWWGTSSAIAVTYGLWVIQYIPFRAAGLWMSSPVWDGFLTAYQQFWRSPLILIPLSIILIGVSLWSANRPVFRLTQLPG